MMTIADQLTETAHLVEATREGLYRRGFDTPPGMGLRGLPPTLALAVAPLPPEDWPDLSAGMPTEGVRGLVQIVPDPDENWAAVECSTPGGYTVDWGDGTQSSHASGATAVHQWTWLPDVEPCSEGYQTSIVTVTPVAGPITAVSFAREVPAWATDHQGHPAIWLDLRFATPSCTSVEIGQARDVVRHQRLRRVLGDMGKPANAGSLFAFCTSLTRVPDILDLSACTNASSLFYFCASLTRVPDILDLDRAFSVQRANLGRVELNRLFAILPAASPGAIITISECPGRATCDRTIATSKGWTVIA